MNHVTRANQPAQPTQQPQQPQQPPHIIFPANTYPSPAYVQEEKRLEVGAMARAIALTYKAPEARHIALQELGLSEQWGVDTRYNDENFVVLHNLQSNDSLLIHRGTELGRDTRRDDLVSDAAIVAGAMHKDFRYLKSLARTQEAVNHLQGRNLHLVGHSLGGTLAHYIGNKLGIDSHAFNPGHSWAEEWRPTHRNGGQHHIYATDGDWISSASPRLENGKPGVTIHQGRNKTGYAHGIANWYD